MQQEHERCRAAVHDRNFFGVDVDIKIVDTQAGAGRHQVFNGRNARAVLLEHRCQTGITNGRSRRMDFHGLGQVDAGKDNAGIGRSRAQGQRHFAARVQTDTNRLHQGFDSALFEHDGLNYY